MSDPLSPHRTHGGYDPLNPGSGRKCPRIAARPDPSMWAPDELLTLAEAAELLWPDGPIVTSTLRTAARQGKLGIAEIAGKFFTNLHELAVMSRCSPMPAPAPPEAPKEPRKPRILSREEAAARLGGNAGAGNKGFPRPVSKDSKPLT